MRRSAAVLALVVVGTLGVSACGDELDVAKLQKTVEREARQVYGDDEVGNVSCPDDVEPEQGGTFECTLEVGAEELTITVTQEDDAGSVSFDAAEAVIDVDEAEQEMGGDFSNQLGARIRVDCGVDGLKVLEPGATFQCVAVDESKTNGVVEVTVDDTDGNISYELVG